MQAVGEVCRTRSVQMQGLLQHPFEFELHGAGNEEARVPSRCRIKQRQHARCSCCVVRHQPTHEDIGVQARGHVRPMFIASMETRRLGLRPRRRKVGRKERRPEPPFLTLCTLNSGASPALVCSLHGALRLTRGMHRYELANFVTTCRRVCLCLQRELLRVQRMGGRLRLGGALGLFHEGSRLSARWIRAPRDFRKHPTTRYGANAGLIRPAHFAAGPRCGLNLPGTCASRLATIDITAGFQPIPRWLLTTSMSSACG